MSPATQPVRLPQDLIDSFLELVEDGRAAALVTVLSTEGSTYSKAGSLMLIGEDGVCHGLLSGGCLENDLVERSMEVIRTGVTEWVEYDLRSDDDVFGLGVGCEGVMRVQMQPLLAASAYEPFFGWLQQRANHESEL